MDKCVRKSTSHYNHRTDWRSKGPGNMASHKYTREFILKHYQNLKEPEIICKSEIEEILLHSPNPPLLTAFFPFSHPFGDEPNSRKHIPREKRSEQMPEWYEDEEPKEPTPKSLPKPEVTEKIPVKEESAPNEIKIVLASTNVKNLQKIKDLEGKDLEEKFTKIDLQVEEKLKNGQNEDEYAEPDWDEPTKEEFTFEPIKVVKPSAPVYDMNLLRYHFAIGNPFAQTLIDFGVPFGKNTLTFKFDTKPYEKIWYYKDLEGQVHGAFSTLEMFAWTIRDCFPPDLEIAIGGMMYFVPMNLFNSVPQMPEPVFIPMNKPKESRTVQEIESQLPKPAVILEKVEYKMVKNTIITDESATLQLKNMLGINK